MSLVQGSFLIAIAAIAIPVVVHLLSRWQVRQLELGTMRFLGEVIRDGAQRRRVRRWLLLITRMAVVALLALLFARPFLPQRTRRDGDRLRVILIDRSASMAMPSGSGRLIDDAVAAASDAAAELGPDAKIQWAWFDSEVTPMDPGTTRPSAPRAVVGDTRYLPALAWARDRVNAVNAIADVVMVTDLQASGLAGGELVGGGPAGDGLRFPADVPVRLIDVGRPAASNLAITHLAIPGPRIDPQQSASVTVTLFNYAAQPQEDVPVTATATAADGGKSGRSVRIRKTVNVEADQAAEVVFDFGTLDPAMWQITVSADIGDDQALDNERRTAIEVAQPTPVLVLDPGDSEDEDGNQPTAGSYHLVTALNQDDRPLGSIVEPDAESGHRPSGRFATRVVSNDQLPTSTLQPDRTPLVVVTNASQIGVTQVDRLASYVAGGGQLLVFAGEAGTDGGSRGQSWSTVAEAWRKSGLVPGHLSEPIASGVVPFRITEVADRGEMLRPFLDPQHGDLSRLSFAKIQPLDPMTSGNADRDRQPTNIRVLARFDAQRPAVTEHTLGDGRVVWFLAAADQSWGRWTASPLYLPLVQQMAADLLGQTGDGPLRFRTVGDFFSGDNQTFKRPGFHAIDNVQYVVNGPPKESDPTRTTASRTAEIFGLTLQDDADPAASRSIAAISRRELWPMFASSLLVLLIAEFCLANRTTA